jgi:flagellar hook-associated protein 1
MTLSIALGNAGSGLAATARAVQIASGNVANAQTPGYAPRHLQLTAALPGAQGAGVRVNGDIRLIDPALDGLLRTSGAARAEADTRLAFWTGVEGAFGLPEAPGSLAGALARLSSALIAAAERPDLDSRLAAVERAAADLAHGIGRIEAEIQDQRRTADAGIARDARALDDGLARLHRQNLDIAALRARGQSTLDLEDARDLLLAELSEIVPLRSHARPDGQWLVFTEGGQVLLDLQPVRIGFQPVPALGAGMTRGAGDLSGLTVNGREVEVGQGGPMAGGRLSAGFALRDVDAPAVQAALDQIAANLVARFEDQATDPSRPPGAPGLFTDQGLALAVQPAPGLAGRLALNALVSPGSGGSLQALRDGLGAPLPGPPGNGAQIGRLLAALDRPLAVTPGAPLRSMAAEIDATLSTVGQSRLAAADRATYAASIETGLRDRQRAGGVDIDAEMRRLLELEIAYAANARVLRVVDEMLKRLLEI